MIFAIGVSVVVGVLPALLAYYKSVVLLPHQILTVMLNCFV